MSSMDLFFADCAATDPCFLTTVFVFPSQIPADIWSDRLLEQGICQTIPSESFISWDSFKESAIQARKPGLQPVSAIVRKLYAQYICAQNESAADGHQLFSDLIPAAYSHKSSIFADWIATLLPFLGIWHRYRDNAQLSEKSGDAEDRDMENLYLHYRTFLEKNALFEPSWELPPLQDTGKKYYILFPYIIDDFLEYEHLLKNSPQITLQEFSETINEMEFYPDSRQEISAAVAEIRHLALEMHVPFSQIAFSVPDLENWAPYIERELSMYGIPFRQRAGISLGDAPGGAMFRLIQECVSSQFSFAGVKSLLLNRQIPWKNRDVGQLIVDLGIQYHCVVSWKENGKPVDIWSNVLKDAAVTPIGEELYLWFKRLKLVLESMTNAQSFSEIRKHYFEFRERFLDPEQFTVEDDLIVSRCIEELSSLIDIQNQYSDLLPQNHFAFFIAHLKSKKYVARSTTNGVSIFPYKVAAGIPLEYHFILDASQEQASIVYGPLSFLRTDKREALHIAPDSDVSVLFFTAYAAGCPRTVYISGSAQTFTGYRTPHGALASVTNTAIYKPSTASFTLEPDLFCNLDCRLPIPTSLYPLQKTGFDLWQKTVNLQKCTVEKQTLLPFKDVLAPYFYGNRIYSDELVRISSTQLNRFFTCPLQWYYGTLLRIEEFSLDSDLIDEKSIGSIVHLALEKMFLKIKSESPGGCFFTKYAEQYKQWIPECLEYAFSTQREFLGPLTKPLLESIRGRASQIIESLITTESMEENFNGLYPSGTELSLKVTRDGMLYNGKIDRISVNSCGEVMIVDYKTGYAPSVSSCIADSKDTLQDHQIPMYVFLIEESESSIFNKCKVDSAVFYQASKSCFIKVITGEIAKKKKGNSKSLSRCDYDFTMHLFFKHAAQMRDAIKNCDFTIEQTKPSFTECGNCPYRMVCRHVYTIQ